MEVSHIGFVYLPRMVSNLPIWLFLKTIYLQNVYYQAAFLYTVGQVLNMIKCYSRVYLNFTDNKILLDETHFWRFNIFHLEQEQIKTVQIAKFTLFLTFLRRFFTLTLDVSHIFGDA